MTVNLPEELAPQLREAAEQLLAECKLADHPEPRRTKRERQGCHVCHSRKGRMGGHHLVPGDDSTVVPVHPSCHVKLHRADRAPSRCTA